MAQVLYANLSSFENQTNLTENQVVATLSASASDADLTIIQQDGEL